MEDCWVEEVVKEESIETDWLLRSEDSWILVDIKDKDEIEIDDKNYGLVKRIFRNQKYFLSKEI